MREAPDQINRDSNPSSLLSRTMDLEQVYPSKLYFLTVVEMMHPRVLSGSARDKMYDLSNRASIQEILVHLFT